MLETNLKYSIEVCISAIQLVAKALDNDNISAYEYRAYRDSHPELDLPSFATLRRTCGSWTTAMESAGLNPYKGTPILEQKYTLEDCISAVQTVIDNTEDYNLTVRDYDAYVGKHPELNLPSRSVVIDRCKSWNNAKKLIELPESKFEFRRKKSQYDTDSCIDALRLASVEITGNLTIKDYNAFRANHPELKLPVYNTISQKCHGWKNAINLLAEQQTTNNTSATSPPPTPSPKSPPTPSPNPSPTPNFTNFSSLLNHHANIIHYILSEDYEKLRDLLQLLENAYNFSTPTPLNQDTYKEFLSQCSSSESAPLASSEILSLFGSWRKLRIILGFQFTDDLEEFEDAYSDTNIITTENNLLHIIQHLKNTDRKHVLMMWNKLLKKYVK